MYKVAIGATVIFIFVLGTIFIKHQPLDSTANTGAPPYGEPETAVPTIDLYAWWLNWQRPDGPPRVGLQVGHWKNDQFPEELARLRGNTGASGGGKWEWEVNLAIAQETKKILESHGITVDLLPATVPPDYWADVFMAIHADGNPNKTVTGYKFANPWRDYTNKSSKLVEFLTEIYGESTGLDLDPNISRNMRGYYAFAWWRYEHSIHPMTPAVIAETGFLTNTDDQQLLIHKPEIPAQALAAGIVKYLKSEGLLEQST